MDILRKIRCPRHWLLIPGKKRYVSEINPRYSKLPKWAFKKWNIPIERPKRDKFGRPIPNYKNYFQPFILASEAIERVYDPLNPVCMLECKKRCFEGHGNVNTKIIKRLNR